MVPDEEKNTIILRVDEISKSSAGRSICRIDTDSMKLLGISAGDIVEVIGKKRSPAIVFPSSKDRGSKLIRIDGLMRMNTGSTIGEYVKVRRATIQPARYVKLSYTQTGVQITGGIKGLTSAMQGKPCKLGDIIAVVKTNVAKKRESLQGPMQDLQKMMGGLFSSPPVSMGEVRFLVKKTIPEGIVQITKNTEISISREVAMVKGGKIITYDDIGGISDVLQKVREMIELPLKHPELFQHVKIDPPKGVLLYGPPGTGKTLLAKAVSHETNAHFININGPEVMSKFYGESEQNLRKIFDEAEKNAPSIIFIDEIDSIASKRENVTGEVERRVVAQLLGMMDGLVSRGRVVIIGATNRIESVDPALRRPGRFDREIELGVPDEHGRLEIFQIHTRGMPIADDVDVREYAGMTHGFVGADIMAISREAAMSALRRILPEIDLDQPIPIEILRKIQINNADFVEQIQTIDPSAMREFLFRKPDVIWGDIGGLKDVKSEIKEVVEWPIKYPELYKRAGIRHVNGVILYGPPGCGKTLLAKAVANESDANFMAIKGPEIFDKFVGESEKAIRKIFKKARQSQPTIIYFDEFDSIAKNRGGGFSGGSNLGDQVVNQILVEMDGIEERKGVVVIASTNRLELIDKAMLRPGRFDRIVYIEAPDQNTRYKILKIHTSNMPLEDNIDNYLKTIANDTMYYSGADLENMCREAGMEAIRNAIKENTKEFTIKKEHFVYAKNKIDPSLDEKIIAEFKKQAEEISKRKISKNKSNDIFS